MSIKDVLGKVNDFFDLSQKKQRKKKDKLFSLIDSLREKKLLLKKAIRKESRKGTKGKKIYHLCKEYKVITKMIKKAKKQQEKLSVADKSSE